LSVDTSVLAGLLAQILDELRGIHGAVDPSGNAAELASATWDPAAPATATWEASHRGSFQGVGVFNLSAAAVRVSLTPGGASAARGGDFTLGPRGFIILPYVGSTLSIGGDAAGRAFVVFTEYAPALNAGTF
jgi:hypothetical protein